MRELKGDTMQKALIFSILIAFQVVILPGPDSALAFFAPLQNVTGPTVTQDTASHVTVSVQNTATSNHIPYTWTITGGAGAITIDQLTNTQGIVAWRVQDTVDHRFKIVWGVYDPGWAALMANLQAGWQIKETDWIDHNTTIVALNDGVLLFQTTYTSAGQTNINGFIWTYDPHAWYEALQQGWTLKGWQEYTYTFIDNSGGATRDHVVKDGVSALVYDNNNLLNRIIRVNYTVYDARNHAWQGKNELAVNPSAPQITNATVTWTVSSAPQKRGYDYTDQTWKSGQDTKVMACFAVWPKPANVNQSVYFTDLSLGATTWNWNLGDGSTSIERSLYHKYSQVGKYTAHQEVTGPAGTDAYDQIVPVKSAITPIWLLLD
jgi:hypothetical protein